MSAKIFERILYNKLHSAVNLCISQAQHGFVNKKSTRTNLIVKSQIISENLNKGIQTDIIYTDMAKAFDSVNHTIMLKKLADCGFSNKLLKLFTSYFENRILYVCYGGARSREFVATTGIPQGANLAGLLFAIYINDIEEVVGKGLLMYADDVKLVQSIRTYKDTQILQQKLYRLALWCKMNNLSLNTAKCNVVSYTKARNPHLADYFIQDVKISRRSLVKDLGVHFASDFSFRSHVSTTTSEAYKIIGCIIRNCRNMSINCLRRLYKVMVRPKLEYCSEVWSPYQQNHVEDLEQIQRRFLKFLFRCKHGEYPPRGFPQDVLTKEFEVDALQKRRICSGVIFVADLIRGDIDAPELLANINIHVPKVNTRSSVPFYIPTCLKDVYFHSPMNRMCLQVNKLGNQLDIFNCNKNHIRQLVLSYK